MNTLVRDIELQQIRDFTLNDELPNANDLTALLDNLDNRLSTVNFDASNRDIKNLISMLTQIIVKFGGTVEKLNAKVMIKINADLGTTVTFIETPIVFPDEKIFEIEGI